ncbi:MAG: hypothetical protein R2813_11645 [Flavobacteriales bacterium]
MKSALVFATCTFFVFQLLYGQNTIYDTVHFDLMRSHLNWTTLKTLDQISTLDFQGNDRTRVVCNGLSEPQSGPTTLHWRRMNNVKNYLIAIGVDSTIIQIEGLCNHDRTEENWLILICYDAPETPILLADNSKQNPKK